MKKIGYLLVVMAAVLWGTLGIPVGELRDLGLTTYEVGVMRSVLGTILAGIFILIYDRSLFRFDPKYILLLVGVGAASQAGLNIGYFKAISELGLGVSVVLLYTSPIFANILSYIVYGEKLTLKKWVSILLAITGSFLAVTGGIISVKLSLIGVMSGLLSGFSFGVTPILSKKLGGKVKVVQILFYSFLSGSIIQLFFIDSSSLISKLDSTVLYYGIILGFFPTILSYTFYNIGMKHIEPGIVSIICVTEVAVAAFIARYYFYESMGVIKVTGIILIITASILPNINIGKRNRVKKSLFLRR